MLGVWAALAFVGLFALYSLRLPSIQSLVLPHWPPAVTILGVDGKALETDVEGFLAHIRQNYLVGDRITLNIIRDGKRVGVAYTLR